MSLYNHGPIALRLWTLIGKVAKLIAVIIDERFSSRLLLLLLQLWCLWLCHWWARRYGAIMQSTNNVVSTTAATEIIGVVRTMLPNNHGGRSTLLFGSKMGLLLSSLMSSKLCCLSLSIHLVALIFLTNRLTNQFLKICIITRNELICQFIIQAG